MVISTEIKGTTYKFELTRSIYKQLLADKEYQKVQNELIAMSKEAQSKEEVIKNVSSSLDCQSLINDIVFVEMIFYYGLKLHQPNMTKEKSSELIDIMFEEDGSMEYVNEIAKTLIESFTQRTTEGKPKRVLTII